MGRPSLIALCVAMASCGQGAGPKSETGSAKPTWRTLDLLAGVPGGHGWVDGALAVAHFDSPWAIASDGGNRLFVADGDTIRVVDRAAGSVTTLAGAYGQAGASDGMGVEARLNSPSGLAFADGQLYVTDTENHTLRKIDVQTGTVTTLAGAPRQPGSLDGPGTAARFQEPEGLALDANGHLYIGDTDNNAIRMFAVATGAVTTIAGTPGMSGSADGVGAQARFSKPTALALDGSGNLYIIDGLNESVRKLELNTGTVSTVAKFAALPQGIATDGNDVLVSLSDLPSGNHGILRISPGGAVTLLAGSAMGQGFVDALGGDARFNSPAGLLNDGAGTLYVADSGNWVLRTIALATGAVVTYAGALSVGSNDGAGASARFSAPQGLATDGQFVYVADTGNDTIRRVVLATGEVTSLAGATGQSGLVDGAPADARLNQPQGLVLDEAAGTLYVADTLNRKIRQIDLSSGKVSTLTYSSPPGAVAVDLDAPSGLALDHGLLFVTDSTDDIVVQIDFEKGTDFSAGRAVPRSRRGGRRRHERRLLPACRPRGGRTRPSLRCRQRRRDSAKNRYCLGSRLDDRGGTDDPRQQ